MKFASSTEHLPPGKRKLVVGMKFWAPTINGPWYTGEPPDYLPNAVKPAIRRIAKIDEKTRTVTVE